MLVKLVMEAHWWILIYDQFWTSCSNWVKCDLIKGNESHVDKFSFEFSTQLISALKCYLLIQTPNQTSGCKDIQFFDFSNKRTQENLSPFSVCNSKSILVTSDSFPLIQSQISMLATCSEEQEGNKKEVEKKSDERPTPNKSSLYFGSSQEKQVLVWSQLPQMIAIRRNPKDLNIIGGLNHTDRKLAVISANHIVIQEMQA